MPERQNDPDQPEKPEPDPAPPTANNPPEPKKLTPEEQMALYEKQLKEEDWGHQPC